MTWWKVWENKRKPKSSVSIICLVGESGSGKTALAEAMKKYGYHAIASYTTRPPRGAQDKSHSFVTPTEFDVLRPEMVACQKFDEFEYGVTMEQIRTHELFVVDPHGLVQLSHTLPPNSIISIYLQTSPAERLRRMVQTRGSDDALRRLDHDINYFHGLRGYDVSLINETPEDFSRNERLLRAILQDVF